MINKMVKKLKENVNEAYQKSNDSKISLYLHIMDILDYYSDKTTIDKKNRIKKDYKTL